MKGEVHIAGQVYKNTLLSKDFWFFFFFNIFSVGSLRVDAYLIQGGIRYFATKATSLVIKIQDGALEFSGNIQSPLINATAFQLRLFEGSSLATLAEVNFPPAWNFNLTGEPQPFKWRISIL